MTAEEEQLPESIIREVLNNGFGSTNQNSGKAESENTGEK